MAAIVAGGVLIRLRFGDVLEPRQALELLERVKAQAWALPAFVGAYCVFTLFLVPVTLFHMVSGAAYGFWPAMALNVVLFNTSSNVQFLLARRLGRRRVAEWLRGARFSSLEARLEREGFRAALIVRVVPIPNIAVNLTAGLSALRWRDFALGSFLGGLPVISVYTWFASALVQGAAEAKQQALLHSALAALAVIAFAVISRLLAKRERIDVTSK